MIDPHRRISKRELREDPELAEALEAPAVPDWLRPIERSEFRPPSPSHNRDSPSANLALAHTFPNLFEHALDRVRAGESLQGIIQDDPRNINVAQFMSWVLRSPERRARFYEAQEVAAEMMALSLITIADATDNPMEDTTRSALRITTRRELMGKWNRKRYGDVKSLEVTSTHIDVAKLKELSLDDLKRMAMEAINSGEVIDVASPAPYQTTSDEQR